MSTIEYLISVIVLVDFNRIWHDVLKIFMIIRETSYFIAIRFKHIRISTRHVKKIKIKSSLPDVHSEFLFIPSKLTFLSTPIVVLVIKKYVLAKRMNQFMKNNYRKCVMHASNKSRI